MALPVYRSKEVKVNWAGADISGLAPDSFITFSYNSNNTSTKVGADGQVEISVLPDGTATCSLTLLQESEGNRALSGVLALLKTKGQVVSGTLNIVDPSGSVLATLNRAHLQVGPEVVMGSETNERTWTFFVEELVFASTPKTIAKNIADSDIDRIEGLIKTLQDSVL